MEYHVSKYANKYWRDNTKDDPLELQRRLITYRGCIDAVKAYQDSYHKIKKTLEREDIDTLCMREVNGLRDFGKIDGFGYETFFFKFPETLKFLKI